MTGVSGVRGVFADTLDPAVATQYAARFGQFIRGGKERATIIVGRDSRTTGQSMFHAIAAGLTGVGCNVVDIGVTPTPTVLLSVKDLHADGGIAITASHNPPEWNAMKFVDGDGMFLSAARAAEFLASVDGSPQWVDWKAVGHVSHDPGAIRRHLDKVFAIPYLDVEAIRARRYKVVVDSVNGAGGLISPLLLSELGCQVIGINSDPTGVFAHPAEPLNHNLLQLEQAVAMHQADIGFATDPDVDRLSIVSEQGKCVGEELSVVLAQLFVLPKHPGDVVVNLSTSMLSDDIAAGFGVKVHRAKVGEINVGKLMQELRSPIGGEGNGGIICPPVNYTRDAVAGMALVLGLMAERKTSLSQIIAPLPRYYFAKGRMEVDPARMDAIMAAVPELFPGCAIDTRDGIKATGDKYWVHVRKSGTEPIIRVYVESASQERSDAICQDTISRLSSV